MRHHRTSAHALLNDRPRINDVDNRRLRLEELVDRNRLPGSRWLAPSTSSDEDDTSNSCRATGTYDPDRYYAAVSEYGLSHMDYIHEAYGDLDMYESNRPDWLAAVTQQG